MTQRRKSTLGKDCILFPLGMCRQQYALFHRSQPVRAVMDACPRGQMNRCLCRDNSKIIWPFNLFSLITCRAKKVVQYIEFYIYALFSQFFVLQCKCNGDERVQLVTLLGCKKGGLPGCTVLYDLYCKDGTQVNPNYIMQQKTEGKQGCICQDNIMPRLILHTCIHTYLIDKLKTIGARKLETSSSVPMAATLTGVSELRKK